MKKSELPVWLCHHNLTRDYHAQVPATHSFRKVPDHGFSSNRKIQTDIADTLNRSKSTISREICRNSFEEEYDPCDAQAITTARRKSAEKATKQSPEVLQTIRKWLRIGGSPEAISCRFSIEFPLQKHVCHTTIYDWINKDRQKGGKLYTYLPRYSKRRWKGGKRKRAGVAFIPDRVDISKRPQIVNERTRIGDRKGDTVYGQNASLVTLVERTSRFTLCSRTQTKCKDEVASVINGLFDTITGRKETLTLNNGSKFAAHSKINKYHFIEIFFAKPYARWQRGTNENTNGRLRRIWPKKFAIATLSQEEINNEVLLLNLTPRKCLKRLTPLEVFTGKRVCTYYLNSAIRSSSPDRNQKDLKDKALSHMRILQKSPSRVKSYFRHPAIKYAA